MTKAIFIALWSIVLGAGYMAKSQPFPHYHNASRAQIKEDIYLYETFFYGKSNGIILESGALDGYRFSTTYMFDKMFNWTSIHIEGSLDNFEKLAQNRPDCINMNVALCEKNRTLHYLSHRGGAVSGIKEFMDVTMLKWRYSNSNQYNETEVPCVTLESAMTKIGVSHVDIWVLDVEGGELSVLRGVNFDTFQADVILMETTSLSWRRAVNFLKVRDYVCITTPNKAKDIENHACVRNGFQPLSKFPMTWPPEGSSSQLRGTVSTGLLFSKRGKNRTKNHFSKSNRGAVRSTSR